MTQASPFPAGTLFYLMGASGSGKDSLMQALQADLNAEKNNTPVQFVRRYITRPQLACAEDHIALSEAEFAQREAQNGFLFAWQAHGYHYGIGNEVLMPLQRGESALMNGSRAYYEQAKVRFPAVQPVVIQVAPEVLEQRLKRRNREGQTEISQRLARAIEFEAHLPDKVLKINNNGPLEQAVQQLKGWILG